MRGRLLLGMLVFTFWGCAKAPTGTPHASERARDREFHESETRRHFRTFAHSETELLLDVKSYALDGEFDWAPLRLKARLTLTVQLLDEKKDEITLSSQVAHMQRVTTPEGKDIPFVQKDGKLVLKLGAALAREAREKPAQFILVYEARANADKEGSFVAVPARKGDPVAVRTVATFSEPLGAEEWMPCHNAPSDRATFTTRFRTPAHERFIANGDLVKETVTGEWRETTYATAYPLPTYLMAFAIGDFEVTTDRSNRVPLQIWARRGLKVDASGLLAFLGETMRRFESLLVPYPFEKYALVLLPAYRGGLEHASITFQGESRSSHAQVLHDRELAAHELAHQWFGDLMTIASWDDLWVKEGMATLLAQEAMRPVQDQSHSGRLFGRDFSVESGEAIRDLELGPNDKYTSGPYGRSAWLYTQLRALWGEPKFWGWLKGLLETHRFGSIGSEAMVKSVASLTSPEFAARYRTALHAKAFPEISDVQSKDGILSFEFSDKDQAMLAPLTAQVRELDGTTTPGAVSVGKNTFLLSPNGLLALDPIDAHPLQEFGFDSADSASDLQPFFVGSALANASLYRALSPASQLDALYSTRGWKLTPTVFARHYHSTYSEVGRYRLIAVACQTAQSAEAAEWKKALSEALQKAPQLGLPDPTGGVGWAHCRRWVTDSLHAGQWQRIASSPASSGEHEPWLVRLNLVSQGAEAAFETSRLLIERGGTVRTQVTMLQLLYQHLFKETGYETPARPEAWYAWLRDYLTRTQVEETTAEVLSILKKGKDIKSLPALAVAFRDSSSRERKRRIFCAAYQITSEQKGEWETFLASVGKPAEFSEASCKAL